MNNLKVQDIIEQTNGELIIGNKDLECKSFSKDTRIIEKGDCYIALKGENFDGNFFWREALEKGAEAVIIEKVEITEEDKEKFKGKTIIKVEDTLEALYKIASYKRSLYDIPVIGITGSVGKTTTKDMVANVVSKKYKTLKTIGNHNNNIGVPFTILELQDEEAMVLEMGMDHAGEIRLLSNIAKPTICIITNIGISHIANLGSKENILKAKLEILEGNKDATIIINNDDKLLHKWYEEHRNNLNVKTFGINEKSDLNARDVSIDPEVSRFKCNLDGKLVEVKIPLGGEHFVLNSLCAISVGKALDIETNKIVEGIEHFELTKNRMDIVKLENDVRVINSAYNSSPEALEASLKSLSKFDGRKIAILGDMINLGEFAEESHRSAGKQLCENKIDVLICSGECSKFIALEAKKEGMKEENIYYLENQNEITELLKKIVKPKDVLMFKASNAKGFYKIAEEFIEYNSNK